LVRKFLIALLVFALIVEAVLTIGGFFLPVQTFKQFGVSYNTETAFLGHIIAWFLLFITIIIGIALWQVIYQKNYQLLCYLLGIWWVGLGISIYVMFNRPDNLLLDSVKGLLLVMVTRFASKHSVQ
jgi:hypothetical protein